MIWTFVHLFIHFDLFITYSFYDFYYVIQKGKIHFFSLFFTDIVFLGKNDNN